MRHKSRIAVLLALAVVVAVVAGAVIVGSDDGRDQQEAVAVPIAPAPTAPSAESTEVVADSGREDDVSIAPPLEDEVGIDQLAAEAGLDALPPGPPVSSGGHAVIEAMDLDKFKDRATVMFVGRVVEEGGSEPIGVKGPPESGGQETVHRVRFAVDRVVRGEDVKVLDILVPDIPGLDTFELDTDFLVFANQIVFGDGRVSGLAAIGYSQGAFRLTGADTATNEAVGDLTITQVAADFGEVDQ